MEVNRAVNVRQVVFLSTAEQVADEFGNRKLSIMAELVESLDNPQSDKDKIFYRNAEKILGVRI